MEIPVRNVTIDEMITALDSRVHAYEKSHRMSSAEMSRRLSDGAVQETEVLLEWMQVYHVLQSLNEPTPTTGTPGTTTGISTSGG